ncbi:MAG: CRTAC1 family protein [Planctomycetota bacterium]
MWRALHSLVCSAGLLLLACEAEEPPDGGAGGAATREVATFTPGYPERSALAEPPSDIVTFVDVAPYVGLYTLEAGWGMSWIDPDGDGDLDLWVANHMHYVSDLFEQDEGGFFRRSSSDLGTLAGLDDHLGIWADYDGDGDVDLYSTSGYYRPDHLFRNEGGGRFTDVTEAAGVSQGHEGRGRSALFGDFNADGFHDIAVFNLYTKDLLYLTRGDGTFEEIGSDAGIANAFGKAGGIQGDWDGDGDLDIYLPLFRIKRRNLMLWNRGDGRFVIAREGSGADILGTSRSAATGDYDGDGDLDLYVTRANETGDVLLRNRGDGTFEDVTELAGIRVAADGVRNVAFVDLDNDGHLDIYASSGGWHDDPNEPNVLLKNLGDGTFEDITDAAGAAALAPGNTGTAAFGDFDGDGFLDIALTNGGGARITSAPHQLLKNRGVADQAAAHWIQLHLRKPAGSQDGLGARVDLVVGDVRIRRDDLPIRVMTQDAPGVHVGLGREERVDRVLVTWPDGTWTQQLSLPADRVHDVQASERGRALDSHPAALLSKDGLVDLDRIEARLKQLWQPNTWPEPDPVEVRRRCDRVLAEDLGSSLDELTSSAASDEQPRDRLELPRRIWVEQVALGHFTTYASQPALPWDILKTLGPRLERGDDILQAAIDSGVRAWGRVRRTDLAKRDDEEVDEAEGADDVRGYLEVGWMTEPELRARFGDEIASAVWALPTGAVAGPFKRRDSRDVQEPDQVWPLLRVFRVGAREEAVTLEPELASRIQAGARSRAKIRDAVQRLCQVDTASSAGSERCWIEGVPFSVAAIASSLRQQARDASEEEHPEAVRTVLPRIVREATLDAAILAWIEETAPSEEDIAAWARTKTAEWTRPPRVEGTIVFASNRSELEDIHAALKGGELLAAVTEKWEIPPIEKRGARSNQTYTEPALLDREMAQRVFDGDVFEELLAVDPGGCTDIYTRAKEHRIFVVDRHVAPEPPSPELARRIARRELMRVHVRQALETLFGE